MYMFEMSPGEYLGADTETHSGYIVCQTMEDALEVKRQKQVEYPIIELTPEIEKMLAKQKGFFYMKNGKFVWAELGAELGKIAEGNHRTSSPSLRVKKSELQKIIDWLLAHNGEYLTKKGKALLHGANLMLKVMPMLNGKELALVVTRQ